MEFKKKRVIKSNGDSRNEMASRERERAQELTT